MIIYQIRNKVNFKSYVGQTVNSIKRRYCQGWHETTHSEILKKAVKKYGKDSFELIILKSGISSIQELNDAERFFIKRLNTVSPNGYNLKSGGENKNHHSETKVKIGRAHVRFHNKTYRLTNHILGFSEFFDCISEFSRKYHLHHSEVSQVLSGKRKYTEGWTHPKTILKSWQFISPKGESHIVLEKGFRRFAIENGLARPNLRHLIQGDWKQYRGWKYVPLTD